MKDKKPLRKKILKTVVSTVLLAAFGPLGRVFAECGDGILELVADQSSSIVNLLSCSVFENFKSLNSEDDHTYENSLRRIVAVTIGKIIDALSNESEFNELIHEISVSSVYSKSDKNRVSKFFAKWKEIASDKSQISEIDSIFEHYNTSLLNIDLDSEVQLSTLLNLIVFNNNDITMMKLRDYLGNEIAQRFNEYFVRELSLDKNTAIFKEKEIELLKLVTCNSELALEKLNRMEQNLQNHHVKFSEFSVVFLKKINEIEVNQLTNTEEMKNIMMEFKNLTYMLIQSINQNSVRKNCVNYVDIQQKLRLNSLNYYEKLKNIEFAFKSEVNSGIFCDLQKIDNNESYFNTSDFSPIIQLYSKHKDLAYSQILLFGDGGMGKTTTLRHLWEYLLRKDDYTLPLYVKLNNYNKIDNNKKSDFIFDFLHEIYFSSLDIEQEDFGGVLKEIDREISLYGLNSIVLMLDGFNEVTVDKAQLINEIEKINVRYKNIKIFLTSRSIPEVLGNLFNNFSIFRMSPLGDEVIECMLEPENYDVDTGLLRNPMMLCLYLDINRILENHPRYKKFLKHNIKSEGELIWNYVESNLQKLVDDSYVSNLKDKNVIKMALELVLPCIGFEMNDKGIFQLSRIDLINLITQNLSDFIRDDYYHYFDFFDEDLSDVDCLDLKKIRKFALKYLKIILEDLVLLREANDAFDNHNIFFEFHHHIFRDFFAAKNVLNEMIVSNSNKKISNIFKEQIFNYHVRKYVGEIEGEHYINYQKDDDYAFAIPQENLIYNMMELCRNVFDGSLGNAVYNLIEIVKTSRKSLISYDLSYLDLSQINLVGVQCSSNGERPSNFNGSKLNDSCIIPQGHLGAVVSLDINEDSNRMITGSLDKKIIEWDLKTKSKLHEYVGHDGIIWSVKYNRNASKILTCSHTGVINEWCVTTGEIISIYDKYKVKIFSVIYSPHEDRILSCHSDGMVIEWSTDSGEIIKMYEAHDKEVLSADYNLSGTRFLTASSDLLIKEWDCKTGDLIMTYEGHEDKVKNVKYCKNGRRFISSAYDSTIREWKVGVSNCDFVYLTSEGAVMSISFNSNETKILSAHKNGSIVEWIRRINQPESVYIGHTNTAYEAKYYKNDTSILSVSHDSNVREWNIKNNECTRVFHGFSNYILDCKYLENENAILTACYDGTVKLWSCAHANLIRYYSLDSVEAISLDCNRDKSKFVVGLFDGSVREYLVDGSTYSILPQKHYRPVNSVKYNSNDSCILTASSSDRIYEINTINDTVRSFDGSFTGVLKINDITYSTDGKYVYAIGDEGYFYKWSHADSSLIFSRKISEYHLKSICAINDSVLFVGDEVGKVLRVNNDVVDMEINFDENPIRKVIYNSTRNSLIIGFYFAEIIEVSLENINKKNKYLGHENSIRSLDVNGQLLFSCSYDNTIKIWSENSVESILDISGHRFDHCSFDNLHKDSKISNETKIAFSKFNVLLDYKYSEV